MQASLVVGIPQGSVCGAAGPLKTNVMRSNLPDNIEEQKFGEITYRTYRKSFEIEIYVLKTCEKEWDTDDFKIFGEDLYNHEWQLQVVDVESINVQKKLLESPEFIADVAPRIEVQRKLFESGVPIPPLILRGKDHLIFDGYARWHLLNEKRIAQCLAYVSSVSETYA